MKAPLLAGGVYGIGYAAGTPGDNWVALILGSIALGIFTALVDR